MGEAVSERPTDEQLTKFAARVVEVHYIAGWILIMCGALSWKFLAVGLGWLCTRIRVCTVNPHFELFIVQSRLGCWGLAGMFAISAVVAELYEGGSK